MHSILVIDIGTSSMRGILFSAQGQHLFAERIPYMPRFYEDGRVEQDPMCWHAGVVSLVQKAVTWSREQGVSIDAVAVTAQRSSAIAVDCVGRALRPAIMWQDSRAHALCTALQQNTRAVYTKTGLRISPVFAAPKFAWVKRQEPDVYRVAHKLLAIADYVLFHMTGKFVTDHTYGSRTLLMDLHTKRWDDDLLNLFDLEQEKLCELVPQGTVLGYTSAAFAVLTGLRSGTPVVSAGGDQQCSALGAGVTTDGLVQVTTGTGTFILAASPDLQLDRRMRVLCNVSAVRDEYIVESSILATASLFSWMGRTFYGSDTCSAAVIEEMSKEAAASPPGANGVTALICFQGKGSPDWNPAAKGSFANLTLATTRADMVRSVLEGIAAEIAKNIEVMEDLTGPGRAIAVAGGLTNLPLFNQMQADMCGRPVRLPHNSETTSLGAWVSAALALGIYSTPQEALSAVPGAAEAPAVLPKAENVSIYKDLRCRWQMLDQRMHGGRGHQVKVRTVA